MRQNKQAEKEILAETNNFPMTVAAIKNDNLDRLNERKIKKIKQISLHHIFVLILNLVDWQRKKTTQVIIGFNFWTLNIKASLWDRTIRHMKLGSRWWGGGGGRRRSRTWRLTVMNDDCTSDQLSASNANVYCTDEVIVIKNKTTKSLTILMIKKR